LFALTAAVKAGKRPGPSEIAGMRYFSLLHRLAVRRPDPFSIYPDCSHPDTIGGCCDRDGWAPLAKIVVETGRGTERGPLAIFTMVPRPDVGGGSIPSRLVNQQPETTPAAVALSTKRGVEPRRQ